GEEGFKPGDVLFRLNDTQLRAEKAIRKAALDAAGAQLDKLKKMPRPEERFPYLARVDEAKAGLTQGEKRYQVATGLKENKNMSLEDWGTYKRAYEVAKSQKAKAEADLKLLDAGAWEADIKIQEVAVAQSKAQYNQVLSEIDRLEVRVP